MKSLTKILIFLSFILLYIIFIYLFCLLSNSNIILFNNNSNIQEDNGDVKIYVSDSLEVQVTRHRWYGTIYENGNNMDIYFLDFIKIPLIFNGNNLYIYHIIFFWMLFILGFVLKKI